MTDDPHILACMRTADMPDPPAVSRVDRCRVCDFRVWVALSSPRKGKLIYCTHCAFDEIKLQKESGEKVEVQRPTAKQINDLARWRRRRGQ